MSKCSTGCIYQDCPTYGACMRRKSVKPTWVATSQGLDKATEKSWDGELAAYRDARRQGIQPATTKRKDVDHAIIMSDQMGKAYQA